MLAPRHLKSAARIALTVSAVGLALLMLQAPDATDLGPVVQAPISHIAVFYVLTALAFLAFPGRRRVDLCLMGAALAAGMEATWGGGLHDAAGAAVAFLADVAGIGAVIAAQPLGRLRRSMRHSAESETRTARARGRGNPIDDARATTTSPATPLNATRQSA